MTFYPGQKVVCINKDGWMDLTTGLPENGPVYGQVYTVDRVLLSAFGYDCVSLMEFQQLMVNGPPKYPARAFRPVVERKTDISIFEKMLKPDQVQA